MVEGEGEDEGGGVGEGEDEAGAEDGGVWLCRGWGCCVEEVVGEAGDLGVVVGVVEAAVLRRKIFYSLHREHQWYIYILWLFLFV
jgi:hypothetical protein